MNAATLPKAIRFRSLLGLLSLLLGATILVSIGIGAVHIPAMRILADLAGHRSLPAVEHTIVFAVRLPRVLAAACVGAALSAAGLLFQGLFRNPLADPYVIGSSSGAVLGAAIGIFWLPAATMFGFSATVLFAFVGGTATVFAVYLLSRINGRTSATTLLLAGFALGTMLNSFSYLIEMIGGESSAAMRALAVWLHGTIGVPQWNQLFVIFVVLTAGLCTAPLLMHRLNTLALGDEYATQLGLHLEWTRVAIVALGALLTAAAVALGGLISFVGLIVPHVARMLLGPDNRKLLPASVLGGAAFLVATDTLARTVLAPSELPAGVLMAFIGGPFFLYMLRRKREGYAL